MRERFLTGYNDFVLPFVFGMLFVLTYCLVGLVRIIIQLPPQDRKRSIRSFYSGLAGGQETRDFCGTRMAAARILSGWDRRKSLA